MEIRLPVIFFYAVLITACSHISNSSVPENNNGWSFTGPGGGGALFNPSLSPHNAAIAFVSCDMTGSFVTRNGGASWRMFNLHGMVDYYVFDPLDSNIIYANSIALFRSKDGGRTWSVLYPAPDEITGIVSKGDHASEMVVTSDSTERSVSALAVDPLDSKKLYAVISINKSIAFYYSVDQGLHWIKEKELEDKVTNIFIVPSSPKENRTVYLTGTNTIAVRENGQWKNNKGPAGVSRLTKFSGGYDAAHHVFIIYAISGKSYYNPKGDSSGIYYTENGGDTWQNRQAGLLAKSINIPDALPEWRAIATSAAHPEILYVSYDNLRLSGDTASIGVAKSEDYGMTWKLSWKDLITKETGISSSNVEGGWINERFGPAWPENPLSLAVSPSDAGICYATDLGRIIKTTNGGASWEQCYTKKKQGAGWISRGIEVTTGYTLQFDPFDKKHAFIADTDIGLLESMDGGESWSSATQKNGVPAAWVNTTYWMAFDPDVKGKAWAVMSGTHDLPRPKMWRKNPVSGFKGGIVVTTDGGKSWQPVSNDIGEAAITHILVDRSGNRNARILYACAFGKGVYKSVDDGKSWKQKNKGIERKEPFVWRIVQNEKDGSLFLIVSRRSEDGSIGNDKDGAIYRSDDGAENWTKISLPAGVNGPTSLFVDPGPAGRIFLSAWGRVTKEVFTSDTGGGLFLSDDGGKTWKQVLAKDQHIYDINYDPQQKRYYACGFNGAAYFSEDTGVTWDRIKGYNFKWGKRVEPDPVNPGKIYILTFGGGIWHGPATGDGSSAEDIITPVYR